jgi:hypothetical protein
MKGSDSDYVDLFRDDAPWATAASHTAVFKTSTQWILNGPPEALAQMFEALKRRGILLAMEALILTSDGQGCGKGIEGYTAPFTMRRAAERIKALGGTLDLIAFDEPLWFGHTYGGANACRSPLVEIARNVTANIRQVRDIFPGVRVGDIEPIAFGRPLDWVDTILRWTDDFKEALGEPLDFFHVDLDWTVDSKDELARLASEFKSRGIRLGIIYNGDLDDRDDVIWTRKAELRFEFVESRLKIRPDDAIFQTWMLHPAKMLSENQPTSLTHLINRYARKRSALLLEPNKSKVTGELVGPEDYPIKNATISLVKVENGRTGQVVSREVAGYVPPTAVKAVIALRLNSECKCLGSADVGVGLMKYSDLGGETLISMVPNRYLLSTAPSPESALAQYKTAPDAPVNATSAGFTVKADHSYHLNIPLRATADAGRAGYLALIFLGADNKEITRHRIDIGPGERVLTKVLTDGQGRFDFHAEARPPSEMLYAIFSGNEEFRATAKQLP